MANQMLPKSNERNLPEWHTSLIKNGERGPRNSVNGDSDAYEDDYVNFEILISRISAQFINIASDQIDKTIDCALKKIVDFLSVDHAAFLHVSHDKNSIQVTHSFSADGHTPFPSDLEVREYYPWVHDAIMANHEHLCFTSPDDLPDGATIDKQNLNKADIQAFMLVSIIIDGSFDFALAVSTTSKVTVWVEEMIPLRLRLLGEIFANALHRKRADESREDLIRFERLISDLSARFVSISSDQIDQEVRGALHQLRAFFDVDRCTLFEVSPHKTSVRVSYAEIANGINPVPPSFEIRKLFPWVHEKVILRGENIFFTSLDELPLEAAIDRQTYRSWGTRSNLMLPIIINGSVDYTISIATVRHERSWPYTLIIERLRLLGEIFANAFERTRAEENIRKSYAEIIKLKERIEAESNYLLQEIKLAHSHGEIIGQSDAIKEVLRQVEQVAMTDSVVLISGETGTGKELVARAVHNISRRKKRLMVVVNCASLPPTLVESELFGREKGAYTGALTRQVGRFEVADGSTMLLDEIGELSPELQAKLLRVLQFGEFERLGSPKLVHVDVRIIAATNRKLPEEVRKGTFREDLYYRLNVFPIEIPPLRNRLEDIPMLVWAFVNEFTEKMGKSIKTIPKKTMEALQRYHWPGNVRELRNVIEHAVIISSQDILNVRLPETSHKVSGRVLSLEEAERRHITDVLEKTGWRIKGRHGAAELLDLKPSTLYTKMNKLHIPTRRDKDGIPT